MALVRIVLTCHRVTAPALACFLGRQRIDSKRIILDAV